MLLQKPLESGDVVAIKTINGEELLAKLVSIAQDHLVISKPLIITLGQDRNGNVGIQMLPYFLLTSEPDAKLTINNQHIMTKALANEQAKAGYLQTTTGLTTAPAGSAIGLTK